jgi:hypothetical protein
MKFEGEVYSYEYLIKNERQDCKIGTVCVCVCVCVRARARVVCVCVCVVCVRVCGVCVVCVGYLWEGGSE